jgi:hypothetical protein
MEIEYTLPMNPMPKSRNSPFRTIPNYSANWWNKYPSRWKPRVTDSGYAKCQPCDICGEFAQGESSLHSCCDGLTRCVYCLQKAMAVTIFGWRLYEFPERLSSVEDDTNYVNW